MNVNSIKGVAAVLMTAGLMSACSSPDGGTDKNGWSQAKGPATAASSDTAGRAALDNGVLHVWPQEVADRILFDTDKSAVKPEGREILAKWVAYLNAHPNDQLMIEGHSDERGTREYNLALGERRADAIKEFLLANGVQANRVKTVSYGKERPAVLGSNEAAYAQNRRGVGVLQ
jgi:peptidoglycan-associated lipoprotein